MHRALSLFSEQPEPQRLLGTGAQQNLSRHVVDGRLPNVVISHTYPSETVERVHKKPLGISRGRLVASRVHHT